MYQKWLKDGLAQKGKSQQGLAKHMGVSAPVVSRMVSGQREIRGTEIQQIASYLGTLPPTGGREAVSVTGRTAQLPVVGVACEGVWRDSVSFAPSALSQSIPALPHPLFQNEIQYAVEVNGLSRKPGVAGDFVICVPIGSLDRNLRANDIVHCKFERTGGLFQEIVRCVVNVSSQTIELAALDQSASLPNIECATAEIRGLVISRVQTFII